MSATTLRFAFPLPPRLNSNTSRSWRANARAKKQWFADCDARQHLGLLPPPPTYPFRQAVVVATLYVARLHDHENAFHRASKYPMDWLKTRGYVVDDSPKHVHWNGIPAQRVTKDGNPYRVELVLTELAAIAEDEALTRQETRGAL